MGAHVCGVIVQTAGIEGFWEGLGAGSGYFCQEGLTDRPQKLAANVKELKSSVGGFVNETNVTRRHDCQRGRFEQRRFYSLERSPKTKLDVASLPS